MRVSREVAAANRDRVVETAARLFREHGYDGIGVADLMKAAGLTHGAFTGQFGTKEALFAEACARAFDEQHAAPAETDGLATRISRYLSREHRDNQGSGCAIPALSTDVARASSEVQHAFAKRVAELVGAFETDLAEAGERPRALFLISAMSGAVSLSRALAVADPELADAVLESVATELRRYVPGR